MLFFGVAPSDLRNWPGVGYVTARQLLRGEHWLFREAEGDELRRAEARGRAVRALDMEREPNGLDHVLAVLDVKRDGIRPRLVVVDGYTQPADKASTLAMLRQDEVIVYGSLLGSDAITPWPRQILAWIRMHTFLPAEPPASEVGEFDNLANPRG